MNNLYEITKEHLEIFSDLEDADGEVSEELAQRLEINEKDLHTKADAYGAVIKEKEGQIETLKKEVKRLQGMIKGEESQITRLKNNLLSAVTAFGKFKTGRFNFYSTTRKSVDIHSPDLLPSEYITTKTTESADKTAIKTALQNGYEVEGAILKESTSLNIK